MCPKTVFHYTAYNLNISSEIVCPELTPIAEPPNEVDVSIRLGEVPEALEDAVTKGVWYQAKPDHFLLRLDEIGAFWVRHGNEIIIKPAPEVAEDDVRVFLFGSVFGALLHQRGALPIHGSAIATPRGAVIFAGPSGRGKSTLAWEFHRRGYRHLCDDISVVAFTEAGQPLVYPAYPQLNLWADVLDKYGQSRDALHPIRSELQKFAFSTRESFDTTPIPLAAVYDLQTTNTNTFELVPLKGLDKLQILVANTYRPRFITDMGRCTEHFKAATAVGQFMLVRRVSRPREPFQLAQLADLIEKDLGL